jgi:ABC-2 type transport system ATP-binding protein
MDEPFSGLDPVNAILLQDTLIELKNKGKAILFSTHRMDQVEKLCDAISLVNRGTVVLSGTMREVKSRYERNRVVIEFEGDDSFLKHESIAEFKNYSGHAELKLKDGADSQALLREAVSKARINKFELVEPSLEEIFIQTVGGKADA